MRSWGWAPHDGISVLPRVTDEFTSRLCCLPCEDTRSGQPATRKKPLTRTQPHWYPDLGRPASRILRNKFQLFISTQSMIVCFSNPNSDLTPNCVIPPFSSLSSTKQLCTIKHMLYQNSSGYRNIGKLHMKSPFVYEYLWVVFYTRHPVDIIWPKVYKMYLTRNIHGFLFWNPVIILLEYPFIYFLK